MSILYESLDESVRDTMVQELERELQTELCISAPG
jgi:hypothetical protein